MENWGGETEDKDAIDKAGSVDFDGFEWDDAKDAENQTKHGVWFTEAAEAFDAQESVAGPQQVRGEPRWTLMGASRGGRTLVVIFTRQGRKARIISARRHKP